MKASNSISIFLSSPGDLKAEREIFEKIIERLNIISLSQIGLGIELLSWERSSWPSVGSDAQQVVSRQIGNEYDIFVGMLWSRIGTPTHHASSGTVEEFEDAFKRNQEYPGSVEIMFYFKNEALPPDLIDIDQLKQVQEFQANISTRGAYFYKFGTALEFERAITLHLSQVIGNLSKRASSNTVTPSRQLDKIDETIKVMSEQNDILDDPDIGFLDAEVIAGEASKKLTLSFETLNAGSQKVTPALAALAVRMTVAKDPNEQKALMHEAAELFNGLSEDVDKLIVDIQHSQQRLCLATIKSLELRGIRDDDSNPDVRELFNSVESLAGTYLALRNNANTLISSVDDMPKVELVYNRARRDL